MKATGIVRRMDELGRVVIPKEIRRTMHLKEGEELEIFTQEEGLFLKKYSTLQSMQEEVAVFARAVQSLLGGTVYVVDTHEVVCAVGQESRGESGKSVSAALQTHLARRQYAHLESLAVVNGGNEYRYVSICPLLAHGDLFGALVWGCAEPIDARAQGVLQAAGLLLHHHLED